MNEELKQILKEKEIAENQFNNASPEFFDIANEQLNIVYRKLDNFYKKQKLLLCQ